MKNKTKNIVCSYYLTPETAADVDDLRFSLRERSKSAVVARAVALLKKKSASEASK